MLNVAVCIILIRQNKIRFSKGLTQTPLTELQLQKTGRRLNTRASTNMLLGSRLCLRQPVQNVETDRNLLFLIFFHLKRTSFLSEMFHQILFFTFVSTDHITLHCELLESRDEALFIPLLF